MIDASKTLAVLDVGGVKYHYYSLPLAERLGLSGISRLPFALKTVLENLLRQQVEGRSDGGDVDALARWTKTRSSNEEIAFLPTRMLIPDSSGIPLFGDLAAMRDAMTRLGGDPRSIDPTIPIDFIVDHSVMVDVNATADAAQRNMALEIERNKERYLFLRWVAQAFDNLRVFRRGGHLSPDQPRAPRARRVDPRRGRPHARLSRFADRHGQPYADGQQPRHHRLGRRRPRRRRGRPRRARLAARSRGRGMSPVGPARSGRHRHRPGADDHPGPAPAQACRQGGGVLRPGCRGVVAARPRDDRQHEPGIGRDDGLLRDRPGDAALPATHGPHPAAGRARGSLRPGAGPLARPGAAGQRLHRRRRDRSCGRRAQRRGAAPAERARIARAGPGRVRRGVSGRRVVVRRWNRSRHREGRRHRHRGDHELHEHVESRGHGRGRAARAQRRATGLTRKPWVKTSLAPGSLVVADYLAASGLQQSLDALGFDVVGFGCTTCMGNSGPIAAEIADAIRTNDVSAVAVLSGNRNFEGRIHPSVRANFLASPPLVVAYALAGSIRADLTREPLGTDRAGAPVYLRDIWPDDAEVRQLVDRLVTPRLYLDRYATVLDGPPQWRAMQATAQSAFQWDAHSSFIRRPPFFDTVGTQPEPIEDIHGARVLGMFGDMLTTDHISPIGAITQGTPAAAYLASLGIAPQDFVNYAARRLNHDVMIRGTFGNIRLRNELTPGREGSWTRHFPDGETMSIPEAAERYRREGVPLVIVGGQEYGAGSSRDWAAKGSRLLGVRAVLAESFERIHRSNLLGMGVLPLEFPPGVTRKSLELAGSERFDIIGIASMSAPRQQLRCTVTYDDGRTQTLSLLARLDTKLELEYYRQGGILNHVLRGRLARGAQRPASRGGDASR